MMERLACFLVGHDRIKMPFGWVCGTCGYEHHRTEAQVRLEVKTTEERK